MKITLTEISENNFIIEIDYLKFSVINNKRNSDTVSPIPLGPILVKLNSKVGSVKAPDSVKFIVLRKYPFVKTSLLLGHACAYNLLPRS